MRHAGETYGRTAAKHATPHGNSDMPACRACPTVRPSCLRCLTIGARLLTSPKRPTDSSPNRCTTGHAGRQVGHAPPSTNSHSYVGDVFNCDRIPACRACPTTLRARRTSPDLAETPDRRSPGVASFAAFRETCGRTPGVGHAVRDAIRCPSIHGRSRGAGDHVLFALRGAQMCRSRCA
jgi:hypothetical protein